MMLTQFQTSCVSNFELHSIPRTEHVNTYVYLQITLDIILTLCCTIPLVILFFAHVFNSQGGYLFKCQEQCHSCVPNMHVIGSQWQINGWPLSMSFTYIRKFPLINDTPFKFIGTIFGKSNANNFTSQIISLGS